MARSRQVFFAMIAAAALQGAAASAQSTIDVIENDKPGRVLSREEREMMRRARDEIRRIDSSRGQMDYHREPRPANAGEHCTRMTRHHYRPVNASPEDIEQFVQWLRTKSDFRFEKRKDGVIAIYVPVLASGPTVVEIEYHMARSGGDGYRYDGWEYAAVSGCY